MKNSGPKSLLEITALGLCYVLGYPILDLEDDVLSKGSCVLDSVLDPSGSSKVHTEKITLSTTTPYWVNVSHLHLQLLQCHHRSTGIVNLEEPFCLALSHQHSA